MVDKGVVEEEEHKAWLEYQKRFGIVRPVKFSKYKADKASERGKLKVTGRVEYEVR